MPCGWAREAADGINRRPPLAVQVAPAALVQVVLCCVFLVPFVAIYASRRRTAGYEASIDR